MTKRKLLILAFEILLVCAVIDCFFLVASSLPPRIIHHKKPSLSVDLSHFVLGECGGLLSWRNCQPVTAVSNLGCSSIIDQPLFGGLTPQYPIATCVVTRSGLPTDDWTSLPGGCIYTRQGFTFFCYHYLIYKDGRYQRVDTMDAFRTLFSPVDSPEEALGFALASGDYFAQYKQKKDRDLVYLVSTLEDTYVKTVTGGYITQVFHTPIFGCGPFYTEAIELRVTYEGFVSEVKRFNVYRNRSNICQD